jgi:hypothetical protein
MDRPGFQLSLYTSNNHYRTVGSVVSHTTDVLPAFLGTALETVTAGEWPGARYQCYSAADCQALMVADYGAGVVLPMGALAHTSTPDTSSECIDCGVSGLCR